MRPPLAAGWLAACLSLVGCGGQAPISPGEVGACDATRAGPGLLVVRVQLPGYALAALLTAYTRAAIDHAVLRLYRRGPDGTYPSAPEAQLVGLSSSQLDAPVVMGSLRWGATYRLQVQAYAGPVEDATTLISDEAASRVEFTTPVPTPVQGVEQVPMTFSVTLPLVVLRDRTYNGSATYEFQNLNAVNRSVKTVSLELTAAGAVVSATTLTFPFPAGGVVSRLRFATGYTLTAHALKGNGALAASAVATFSTPAVSEAGTVDDGPFGPIVLHFQ